MSLSSDDESDGSDFGEDDVIEEEEEVELGEEERKALDEETEREKQRHSALRTSDELSIRLARSEAAALALAMIPRLGEHSPASGVASDTFLLRSLCDQFITRVASVESIALAPNVKSAHAALEDIFDRLDQDLTFTPRAVKCGLFETTVATMGRFKTDPEIQTVGIAIFSTLLLNNDSELQAKASESGFLAAAIAALAAFPSNSFLLLVGLECLAHAALDETNRRQALSCGALPFVISRMSMLAGDEEVCRWCCECLSSFAAEENAKQQMMDRAVVESVIALMARHHSYDLFVQSACDVLRVLCEDSKILPKVVKRGAIEALLSLMKRARRSPIACTSAMDALSTIAGNAEACHKIIELEGPKRFVMAMKRFNDHPGVMVMGCSIVSAVTTEEEAQLLINGLGGAEIIGRAMKLLASDDSIQEVGCAAIANLAVAAKTTVEVAGNTVEPIAAALKAFPDNEGIAQEGFRALWVLADDRHIRMRVAECGTVALAVAAMRRFPTNSDLQENSSGFLGSVLASDEAHSKFMCPEALAAVEAAAARFPGNAAFLHFSHVLKRCLEPAVARATEQGLCTATAIPACKRDCPMTDHFFCSGCCTAQPVIQCMSCDGQSSNLRYCIPCATQHHSGHQIHETWESHRCACTRSECKGTAAVPKRKK